MVAMDMGIDHEADRTGVEFLDCGYNFFRERSELAVYHQNAIRTHQYSYVSSIALELIEIVGELCSFDFDLAHVDLLGRGAHGNRHYGERHQRSTRELKCRYSHSSLLLLLNWES